MTELKSSPYKVLKSELPTYYFNLLNHFQKRIHSRTGNAILLAICKSFYDKENIEIFARERMIEYLPFAQKEYKQQLLDLLYILVSEVPDIFNERIATQIQPLAETEPRKVLTLIAIFAQKFDEVHDPLPMVDILFRKADYFRAVECADDYLTLLVWLMTRYPSFKKQRSQHCWTYVCDMLTLTNVAILNTCYYALCAIADVDRDLVAECGYPVSAVSRDIRRRPVKAAALSLILRFPPTSETRKMEETLKSLVIAAAEDDRAALILMGLAQDTGNAMHLLQNPDWMTRGLPTAINTMLLLCIILLHTDLRQIVVETPKTVDLLNGLLLSNSVGMTEVICIILRRLPLTPDFVQSLSESGFLGSYFSSVLENEDADTLMSALRVLDALSRVCYVREMSEMVDTVVRLIKEPNTLSSAAASVSVDLAKHSKCASMFKQKKLPKFFKQPDLDPKLKKYGNRFLSVIASKKKK
ncbi:hypothetical protein TVAG_324080 [Trichomonas vaginalis G3]|uniref:Uncharacterized protein n=1 Tax=Trichomonas vaginalis (strain ATCC PRA-98 / G3) TaxID=412133 RepID=A2F4B0_TRIV3|nr:protein kinase protein [Trichomonas vaginalis G3]EAY00289.1 hypothetical protein TVAG_324080 [Trichomonas vaginalis G3]KAI5492709.1 protein kinase protein [Trichomonas vaginalis G3]|eukprot:XP_001313218.1 hypothetical protein [Trichomonas vaginalis G3]